MTAHHKRQHDRETKNARKKGAESNGEPLSRRNIHGKAVLAHQTGDEADGAHKRLD